MTCLTFSYLHIPPRVSPTGGFPHADDDRYVSDGGGDRYAPAAPRDDDPYADARPLNDADRFNRPPFAEDRMRQTPSPSGT